MNFSTYIELCKNRKDTIGEFSRLVLHRDDLFPPSNSNSRSVWSTWLTENGATKETVTAFASVWAIYDKQRNVVSLSDYRIHKANRSPAEKEFAGLDRLHRLE